MLVAWSDEDTSFSSEVSDCDSFSDSSYYSSESENENSLTFRKLCKRFIFYLEKSREKYKILEKENTYLQDVMGIFWTNFYGLETIQWVDPTS